MGGSRLHWVAHAVCVFLLVALLAERHHRGLRWGPAEERAMTPVVSRPLPSKEQLAPAGARSLLGVPGPRRALITGITGMIGSAVAEALVNSGAWEVHGLVRWRSNSNNLRRVYSKVKLHYGDIEDPHRMLHVISDVQPDVLFHFAAQAYNGVSWDNPYYTLSANILGTLNILEAVRLAKLTSTRLVVAGSSTEYGHTTSFWKGPVPETAPLIPVTPYGVSKLATESLARAYFLNFQIPVVVVRLFVHVGTGHTENQALQNFCLQVAEIEAGLRPPVLQVGRLDTRRDITDIRDSAPVLVALADKGVPGEAYNVASGTAIQMKSLLD
eukprot:RCo018170